MPFVPELLRYTNDYFVETGTYQGETIERVRDSHLYQHLYSMELSLVYYERCVQRIQGIHLVHGNSRYDLAKLIAPIERDITFWLDSHWSGAEDIGCDPEIKCPILYELEQIKQHPLKTHTIMVDDMRLMDGDHFLVTREEIEQKIKEINPNYTLTYYKDAHDDKDVLVAHLPRCVHHYLRECKTNPQPPGLGDFLRGSLALHQFAQRYGYTLYLDDAHPLFRYVKPSAYLLTERPTLVVELIPPMSYEKIRDVLKNIFQTGMSCSVLTNSFYEPLSQESKTYFKRLWVPSEEMERHLEHVFRNEYKLPPHTPYTVFHVRVGDASLHRNEEGDQVADACAAYLKQKMEPGKAYVLLSDSASVAERITEQVPVCYWKNEKIHLGDLKRTPTNEEGNVRDTMTDFFILSRASRILSNGSGFSRYISEVLDIPYELF